MAGEKKREGDALALVFRYLTPAVNYCWMDGWIDGYWLFPLKRGVAYAT